MTDSDRDLDDEIAAHLRMAVDERMARGASRVEAERAARREFGNVTHVREVTRDQRLGLWLERLTQDVRYGVRSLRRAPAFTFTAIATLALAIGANSALFTVVDSVLLRPLPFLAPERLAVLSFLPSDLPFELPPTVLDHGWLNYRDRQESFSSATAYIQAAFTLSGRGDAVRLSGARVDARFVATLGVLPAIGRSFTADEEAGDQKLVLLSHRLWRDRFAADPSVVGTSISLGGEPYRVSGVMPAGFSFPDASDFWVPLHVRANGRVAGFLSVLGRLRDGATAEQARAELTSILVPQTPVKPGARDRQSVAAVIPLRDALTANIAPSLWVLSGAVGFVLLVACANVANLLLMRAMARRHEMAVRVAIGAGRLRIARQLLTESLLLGLGGGIVGLVLASGGTRALIMLAPAGRIPRIDEVHLNASVFAFTLGLAVITGIAFGLIPAIQGARRPPQDVLSGSARSVAGAHGRLRAVLVAAEVALALVLLTGAGLMIKSFVRLREVDKGFDGGSVMTMSVDLPNLAYPDAARLTAFHGELLGELARFPGVRGVGAASSRPLGDVGMMGSFAAEGSTRARGFMVDKTWVSAGYFATMGLRLLGGRGFVEPEGPSVVLSESVARTLWPDEDPVGRRISMQAEAPRPDSWLTVVGVVSDVVQDRSMARHATMYFPYQGGDRSSLRHMSYVVRAEGGAKVAPAMRAALAGVDPTLPAQGLMSMDDALMDVVAEPVFQTRLLAVFALMALLLAAIGTYGVLAYDVAQRKRELALMMALGATPGKVVRMVMRRTGLLTVAGVTAGVAGSLALTRVLKASLFDVRPTDPVTFGLVVLAVLAVATLAGLAPARRAARVSVLTALSGD